VEKFDYPLRGVRRNYAINWG